MFGLHTKTDWKYFKIEFLFFIFICYIGSIISDIEYSFYEEKNVLNFTSALEARMVWGTFSFAFYGTYYWGFLKRNVFRKKTLPILISVALFIVLKHLYDKFIMNLMIANMSFLSDQFRAAALKDFNRPALYFIVSYTLNRILFTIIGFAFLIRSLQQEEQLKILKEQQLSSELTYLKAQLQPHFFFNTLNNIYSLALQQSKETAPLVAKLAEMMRYIIYKSEEKLAFLKDEIEFIRNYVAVEQVRYRTEIDISFEAQGINDESKISPLLLLPFIENAFKHGVQEETESGFVKIIICKTEAELTLEVTNSVPAANAVSKAGIGLTNVQKRLALLYPEKHTLIIDNSKKIYNVSLTLNL